MIFIDPAVGSREFKSLLKSPCQLESSATDFWWLGNSPNGTVAVALERKQIMEIVGTVKGDSRMEGEQLPKLKDFQVRYLLIEGELHEGSNGMLETKMRDGYRMVWKTQGIKYGHYQKYLYGMIQQWGLQVVNTLTKSETASTIDSLYEWWQSTQHHSEKLYCGHLNSLFTNKGKRYTDEEMICRKMVFQLPRIGSETTIEVVKSFHSIREAINADEQRWQQLSGIGKKSATEIVRVINHKWRT
jgi:ERCC4-type nuclease